MSFKAIFRENLMSFMTSLRELVSRPDSAWSVRVPVVGLGKRNKWRIRTKVQGMPGLSQFG